MVLKSAVYIDSDEVIQIGELQLFMHPDFIVTIRHGNASPLTEVRARIDSTPALLQYGPAAVLYGVVDHIVDDYDLAAQGVEVDIQQVEDEVFSPERTNPAERIYYLEREVLAFQRAVTPLLPAVDRLARGHFPSVPDDLHEYFRDVHDHLLRSNGQIESFRDLLSNALQANLTQVSVRQNDDMRRISAWVAIAAVPTGVAAIYGMNFTDMPELRWHYGYPAVLLIILIVCIYLHRRFHRAGWL
jgi:magnesium transporter